MRNLMILSLISFVGLQTTLWATSSPQNIQQIIHKLKEGKNIKNTKIILSEVQFQEGRSDILSSSKQELDEIAELLLQIPTVALEISNHTDNKGDKNAKKQLSQRRAKNVVDYLNLKGVPFQQLNYKGWGWHRPISDNRSKEGRLKNNRTELLVTGLVAGPHQIITKQQQISVSNFLLEGNKLVYWKTNESAAKSLTVSDIQQIEMSYGKQLKFNTETLTASKALENTQKKESPKNITQNTPPKDPFSYSKTKENTNINTTNSEHKTSVANTSSKKETNVKNPPTNTSTRTVVTTREEPRKLDPIATPNTNNTAERATLERPKQAAKVNTPQAKPKPEQSEELIVNTNNNNPPTQDRNTPTETDNDVVEDSTIQDMLTYYLHQYPLANPRRKKKVYPSENILSNFKLPSSIPGGANGFGGGGITPGGKPDSKIRPLGLIVQLGRQPLKVAPSFINMTYLDASDRIDVIRVSKNLEPSSTGIVIRLGYAVEVNQWTAYLAGDFGGRSGARYNAAGLGLLYTKKIGKLRLMPGAEINLGAGKFKLATADPETPIFQVKKKEFLGNDIDIYYKNKLLGISPSLNIAYPIGKNLDLYLSGGYAVAMRTGTRIKFSGDNLDDNRVHAHEKLSADGLTFKANGEIVTKNADIFSYNGLFFKVGIMWK